MRTKPCTYNNDTHRFDVVSDDGKPLEKGFIYLPPDCWDALIRLARKHRIGKSRVIEQLVSIADASRVRTA